MYMYNHQVNLQALNCLLVVRLRELSVSMSHMYLCCVAQVVGDICNDPDMLVRNLTQDQSDTGTHICTLVTISNFKTIVYKML